MYSNPFECCMCHHEFLPTEFGILQKLLHEALEHGEDLNVIDSNLTTKIPEELYPDNKNILYIENFQHKNGNYNYRNNKTK